MRVGEKRKTDGQTDIQTGIDRDTYTVRCIDRDKHRQGKRFVLTDFAVDRPITLLKVECISLSCEKINNE